MALPKEKYPYFYTSLHGETHSSETIIFDFTVEAISRFSTTNSSPSGGKDVLAIIGVIAVVHHTARGIVIGPVLRYSHQLPNEIKEKSMQLKKWKYRRSKIGYPWTKNQRRWTMFPTIFVMGVETFFSVGVHFTCAVDSTMSYGFVLSIAVLWSRELFSYQPNQPGLSTRWSVYTFIVGFEHIVYLFIIDRTSHGLYTNVA